MLPKPKQPVDFPWRFGMVRLGHGLYLDAREIARFETFQNFFYYAVITTRSGKKHWLFGRQASEAHDDFDGVNWILHTPHDQPARETYFRGRCTCMLARNEDGNAWVIGEDRCPVHHARKE